MKIIKTSFKQKTFAKRVYENMKKHSLWVFSKDFKKTTTKKLRHVWRSVLPSFQTWLLIFSYYFQIYPINNSFYLFFFFCIHQLYTIYYISSIYCMNYWHPIVSTWLSWGTLSYKSFIIHVSIISVFYFTI